MRRLQSITVILVGTVGLVVMSSSTVLADRLWDQGRSYGTFLNGHDVGVEMNVMSAQARGEGGRGVERVRAWARLDNLRKLYSQYYYATWVNGAEIRMYSDDYRRNYFYVTGTNPPDASHTNIGPVFYEIAGYAGIPTSILQVYTNEMFVSGISSKGLGSYDLVRTFKGASANSINLPNSVPYSDADRKMVGQKSSIQVHFSYDLRASDTSNFSLWPQVKIQYGISHQGGAPFYLWTNYAGVKHKVNRT